MSDIMKNPAEAKTLIEQIKQTERYQGDFEFRAFMQTGEALLLLLGGQAKETVELCDDLIERSTALRLWRLVSANQNLIGSAYLMLGIPEYALESYKQAVQTEKEQGLSFVTSLAYNNIALIYTHWKSYEEVCKYLRLALETLECGETDEKVCRSKQLQYLGNLIPALCRIDQTREIPSLLEKMEELSLQEKNASSAGYLFYYGKMFYDFHCGRYEQAKAMYYKARSFVPRRDLSKRIWLLCDFLTLCEAGHLDLAFYEKELLAAEPPETSAELPSDARLYRFLRNYYRQKGNKERLEHVNARYIELLEQDVEGLRRRKLRSIQLVDFFLEDVQIPAERRKRSQDIELHRIAEEVVRRKHSMQETYSRFVMINELGKNMTSSLDLEKVIDFIYRNLNENIPLDSFVLMVADRDKWELRSVAYYENGNLKGEFRIDLANPDSLFAECYRTGRLILSDNIYQDPRFQGRHLINIGNTTVQSAVYIPLKVGDELLGVFSLQHRYANAYTDEHLVFLEVLLPYLSIALNNAIQSGMLKREIASHLRTQRTLELANSKLAHISSRDDLTQISNRRDFEVRVIDLLRQAKKDGGEISVFMFDIDNFKLYNDTYGHLEGDLVLKKIAQLIDREIGKAGGLSARFGGEEFVAACRGLSPEKSGELAEKIRRDVHALEIENEKAPLRRLSISVGVAVAKSPEITDKSVIMRRADVALYEAKNSGKNRVVLKEVFLQKNASEEGTS